MAWVTKDSTETYNQTPEPPREYTKKEKAANWWHYHWMAVVVAVLVVVFGVWIIKDTVFQTRPDVQVAYVGTSDLPTDTVTALQDALTPFCSDLNGDGKQDDEDLYGLGTSNVIIVDAYCSAYKMNMMDVGDDGFPYFSIDLDKFSSAVDKIFDLNWQTNGVHAYKEISDNNEMTDLCNYFSQKR